MRQNIPSGIFDLIERELSLSADLLALLKEEQEAVVALRMSELVAISRRKTELIELLRDIDEQLRLQVEQCTGQPSPNAVRLSDLAAMTEGAAKERLEQQRKKLVALRQDIAAKSVINQHFVEDTKRHLQEAISLITNAAAAKQQQVYGKPGRPGRRNAGAPTLISREV